MSTETDETQKTQTDEIDRHASTYLLQPLQHKLVFAAKDPVLRFFSADISALLPKPSHCGRQIRIRIEEDVRETAHRRYPTLPVLSLCIGDCAVKPQLKHAPVAFLHTQGPRQYRTTRDH